MKFPIALLSTGLLVLSNVFAAESALQPGQWPVEKANQWYAAQPWIVGCNFLPSTAINGIEMWQSESFDPLTIDRELALAHQWGLNSVRVFLNYLVWESEPDALKKNFATFLDIAEKHKITVMPILLDDCGSRFVPKLGKQPDPIPGVHNSAWVQSPHPATIADKTAWPKLKAYVQDIVKTFANDKRIVIWDLYNEPHDKHVELIKSAFAWAREMEPIQPLTTGLWDDFASEKSQLLLDISDIASFHGYDNNARLESKIKRCAESGRPVVCTEWMFRQAGNTPRNVLPLFKKHKVAAYHWGLVEGRTQTYLHHGSREGTPKLWQHDLIRADGTHYKDADYHYFRHIILDEDDLTPESGLEQVLLPTSENSPQVWKYTEDEPTATWFEIDFADANWETGNAPFGREEPPYAGFHRLPATQWLSSRLWLRMSFELTEEQVKNPGDVFLRAHFDEDAIVYVNGKFAAELPGYNGTYMDVEMSLAAVNSLRPGKNVIAVHVQNKVGGQYFDVGIVKVP